MDKWEYRRGDALGPELKEFNELGKQGWEAVGSIGDSTYFLFKRKIPSSPTQSVQTPAQTPSFDDDFGIRF